MLGRRDLEALHPRRQGLLVIGLDEQVNVRALDAQLHDPEPLAPGGGQRRLADRLIGQPAPQAPDRTHHAQRHVDRMPRLQVEPCLVRRPGACALARTPSPAAFAAALLEQHQLLGFYTRGPGVG